MLYFIIQKLQILLVQKCARIFGPYFLKYKVDIKYIPQKDTI